MSADADKSGELDTSELKQVLIELQLGLNEDEMDQLVDDCDGEHSAAAIAAAMTANDVATTAPMNR
eukprot:COSAG02_NODE_1708_length_11229_cov_14.784097_6_plen_66_part_00